MLEAVNELQLVSVVLLVLTVPIILTLFLVNVIVPVPRAEITDGLIVIPLMLVNASLRNVWIVKLFVVTDPTKKCCPVEICTPSMYGKSLPVILNASPVV